jgi:carbon storage regulator CsrA
MLVLSRKEDQSILFPNLGISIEIVRVQGNKVSVGVEAPKAIRIVRGELHNAEDFKSEAAPSDLQLEQFIEVLPKQTRSELRDRLNVAGLAVHAAQKQCQVGGLENAEFFLSKAVEALAALNKMFDLAQVATPSDCVKEQPSAYGLACGKPDMRAISDRRAAGWFPEPSLPPQLVVYLQHTLCSYN